MKKGYKVLQIILIFFGAVFLVMVTLSFTTAPFWIWYHLGVKSSRINRPPDIIVVMGGGGMPSESGLMRCYYAAKVANHFNRAKVIIALPGDTADSESSVIGMKKELVLRGIEPQRIFFENSGTNTRSQALNIFQKYSEFTASPAILLISSPEHLHRAVLSFRKAGFLRVDGVAAWERAIESDINFSGRLLGGRRMIPDIGENLALRYEFWTQMNYELIILREWFALGYYQLKGWI